MSLFGGLLRDSLAGELVYLASRRRLFKPRVERDDYEIPAKYLVGVSQEKGEASSGLDANINNFEGTKLEKAVSGGDVSETAVPSEAPESESDEASSDDIIVDWDGPDDPDKPTNWSFNRKVLVCFTIALCTMSLYMGAGIFTPAIPTLIEEFHTSQVKVTLGLTFFVWGYGSGCLWFTPMSENPLFGGRNYIYLFCQFFFVILQIPTALTNHVAPFVVLRLLAGWMASPPLATGAASFTDVVPFPYLVYCLIGIAMTAICGPFLGPLIGGALELHGGWRWIFWFLLILAGGVGLFMFLFLPETSEQALLMRKARSLRRITGNPRIVAPGEIALRTQTTKGLLKHIFYRPLEITIREPIMAFINLHLALVYAVLYLYFEAFPLAYGGTYHFHLIGQGLSYLSLLVGCIIALPGYMVYLHYKLLKPLLERGENKPEKVFGDVAIFSSVCVPVGILIFGWTVNKDIHWIVSMIGNAIFVAGGLLLFQSYLAFVGAMYPPHTAGSAFASNSLARASLGGAFPLFGHTMYKYTGTSRFPVGWGCTILALFSFVMIGLALYIRFKGRYLRERGQTKYANAL